MQRFLRLERRVNDIAHLVEQTKPLITRHQFGKFVVHNSNFHFLVLNFGVPAGLHHAGALAFKLKIKS